MKCKWCGKETDSTFCSNKCIAEHDNHHGISIEERKELQAKQDNCVTTCCANLTCGALLLLAVLIMLSLVGYWAYRDYSDRRGTEYSSYLEWVVKTLKN